MWIRYLTKSKSDKGAYVHNFTFLQYHIEISIKVKRGKSYNLFQLEQVAGLAKRSHDLYTHRASARSLNTQKTKLTRQCLNYIFAAVGFFSPTTGTGRRNASLNLRPDIYKNALNQTILGIFVIHY